MSAFEIAAFPLFFCFVFAIGSFMVSVLEWNYRQSEARRGMSDNYVSEHERSLIWALAEITRLQEELAAVRRRLSALEGRPVLKPPTTRQGELGGPGPVTNNTVYKPNPTGWMGGGK